MRAYFYINFGKSMKINYLCARKSIGTYSQK